MASFANSLRSLLGRGQPFDSSTPDSMARSDGTSDSRSDLQQMHRATPPRHDVNGALAAGDGPATLLPEWYEVAQQDHAHQSTLPHQHSQPGGHLAVQQGGDDRNHVRGTMYPLHEPGHGVHRQYVESTSQMPSRTASTKPPKAYSYRSHIEEHPQALCLRDEATHASVGVEVKQGPVVNEHDDHDIFAEFTNEEFHDDDAQTSAATQQASKSADQTAFDLPMIKQEPGSESQLPAEATQGAETVNTTITASRSAIDTSTIMTQHTQGISAAAVLQPTHEHVASSSRVPSEPKHLQSQTSSSRATHIDDSQQQYSFEKHVQAPQQSVLESQAQLSYNKTVQSPSVDCVIGGQRHSSEKKTPLLGDMDLSGKSQQLAQQWQERQKLFSNGVLTADAVHASPVLLHGPRPTQQQKAPHPATGLNPPYGLSSHQTRSVNGVPCSSTSPYNSNPQHPTCPMATEDGQHQPPWMSPGWGFGPRIQQAPPSGHSITKGSLPQGSVGPQRITGVQEKGASGASDDDEPLATRVPRHRSTASPMPFDASLKLGSTTAAYKPYASNVKQDPVIELSDDNNGDTTEFFSWKLPDFEVTYHPPATANDLPMAKVSTLGSTKNLVRSEVALTEDHAHHEMELFLNVFLPAQQALQTPDPEPAHAVINFHTISVMILEAFVQYEIGDEMGRGYGFHGGNIGSQALRPSPSSSDGEPARTRSAKDADVDEIFFAVIDRWRAGLMSGKGTLKLIRGCQEFCDIALDVIHYVKEHGLSQPEPKKRKERSDKGVKRGPKGGAKENEAKVKATGKRKAEAVEGKAAAHKGNVNEPQIRKKARTEVKKTKPKPNTRSPGVTILRK